MNKQIGFSLVLLALSFAVQGSTISYNVNATIPDGDFNGYQNSQTISGLSGGDSSKQLENDAWQKLSPREEIRPAFPPLPWMLRRKTPS